jgi:hypothetical protein
MLEFQKVKGVTGNGRPPSARKTGSFATPFLERQQKMAGHRNQDITWLPMTGHLEIQAQFALRTRCTDRQVYFMLSLF